MVPGRETTLPSGLGVLRIVLTWKPVNSDGDFSETDGVAYYHAKTLFAVYALSDSSGSVVERYRFDASVAHAGTVARACQHFPHISAYPEIPHT